MAGASNFIIFLREKTNFLSSASEENDALKAYSYIGK